MILIEKWGASWFSFIAEFKSYPRSINYCRYKTKIGDTIRNIEFVYCFVIKKAAYIINENVWPLSLYKSVLSDFSLSSSRTRGFSGGFRGGFRCSGSVLGVDKAVFHNTQLTPEKRRLDNGNASQDERQASENLIGSSERPIVRRLGMFFLLLCCALGCGLRGGEHFYRKRNMRGCAWIVGGWFLALVGIGLICAGSFHSTWEWPI